MHLPLVERFERGGGLRGRQTGSGLMLVENGVLSSGREVFVRGCLQPGAEGGTTAGRAGTGGEIAAGSRMTRPVRIRITVGRCAAVATSAVTARWCLDHSIRCSHLHVGRCLGWSVRTNLGKPRRRRGGRARARTGRRVGVVMQLPPGRGREETAVSGRRAGIWRGRRCRRAHRRRRG